jgi:hypothetical protein
MFLASTSKLLLIGTLLFLLNFVLLCKANAQQAANVAIYPKVTGYFSVLVPVCRDME